MSFTFAPAERRNTHLLVSLAGASGSGKTFSAMNLATGICGDEPFAVIDTEAGRALHYADQFKFHHLDFAPPFTPERYLEAVKAAEAEGFKAIVVDSMSHEFDGQGGIMEMAETNASGVPKPGVENPRDPKKGDGWKDWAAKPAPGPGAWKEPKMRHKKMMNAFLQVRTHLIFCLRAEEKIDMSRKDDRGRVIVENAGWFPIQEKRFSYEMTASFTLNPASPGVVDLTLPHKVQDQHRMSFLPGQHITAEAGGRLAEWARGETITAPDKELWDRARRIAHEGIEQITTFFQKVASEEERAKLQPIRRELWDTAKRADENKGELT